MADAPTTPPAEQPAIKHELIGYVWVDTGRLVITDPSYADQVEADRQEKPTRPHACELVGEGLAVLLGTALRNNRYPVVAHRYPNGCLASVEIVLDERPIEPEMAKA